MHVVSKKRISQAKKKYPQSATGLNAWHKVMKYKNFIDYSALKKVFNSVDKVGRLYVFNIGGNKYRLIASIHFNRNKVYIREILSHSEYDTKKWRE